MELYEEPLYERPIHEDTEKYTQIRLSVSTLEV